MSPLIAVVLSGALLTTIAGGCRPETAKDVSAQAQRNGVVDAADYLIWRKNFGAAY